MRWYTGALGDHGVDAYLKLWIALEILAMLSTEFGLRSRIVHKGWAAGLDGFLLDYLEAVVGDVLCAALNQPCLRKAEPLAGKARELLTSALRNR